MLSSRGSMLRCQGVPLPHSPRHLEMLSLQPWVGGGVTGRLCFLQATLEPMA